MGEAVYLKTSCLKCGGSVEFPEEAENSTVPCPHCGKDLFLYREVRAVGTPPMQQVDLNAKPATSTPIHWNPLTAARWSFWLFSPAFGAFLHAKNAESMGRAEEAKANWQCFYIALGYPAGVADAPNRLGGNDVHLIVVGNDYDDLGTAR
jgi:predicted RNA-binding Zn-ribbon protein involved in translation (DUF1610 family)